MDRIKLNDDLEFSRLVYGMWRIGDVEDTSPAAVEAKIHACLEQGITTFDQADIYGDYGAEAILGGALKANASLREKMEIVTKCDIVAPIGRYSDKKCKYYDTSRAHIELSVETSLTAMGIEQIDLLLIHRPDPLMDHAETGAALDEGIASGKVRAAGVSNFRAWVWDLLQSAMSNKLVTNQIEMSLLCTAPWTNGDLATLHRLGVPPMAWSPLGGGALFDGSNPGLTEALKAIASMRGTDTTAVAIAWLLAHPANILPVLGTNRLDRIAAISAAMEVDLTRAEWLPLYTEATGQEVP